MNRVEIFLTFERGGDLGERVGFVVEFDDFDVRGNTSDECLFIGDVGVDEKKFGRFNFHFLVDLIKSKWGNSYF